MDMSNFRPELHVAQQSRRDKLRVQHDSNPPHYQVYANNLQLPPHDALNYESNNLRNCRPGNICYDPSDFCSEMPNFSMNSQGMLPQKDAMMVHQEPDKRVGEAFFGSLSRTIPTTFNPSATISSDPQYFTTWKSIGSQSSSDWVGNQSPMFVGEGLSGSSLRIVNSCTPMSTLEVKPYLGYQELHPPLNTEVSNQSSQNKHYGDVHCSSSLYQNAFQELVTASNDRSSGLELRQKSSEETSHGPWVVGGGELLLLPAYADQLRLKSHVSQSVNRPSAHGCNQWSGELDYAAAKNADNSNSQALSLSLSSVPLPKVHATHIADRGTVMDLLCGDDCAGGNLQGSRALKPENLPSNPNVSTGGKGLCNVRPDAMAIPALTHRNPGPLGPFTGYATILRSSKYLRPAQQLLDELCIVARPKHIEICNGPEKILEEVRVSSDAVSNADAITGDSSGSSFVFNGSNDKGRDPEGASCSADSYRPENLQKKAKLLYMLDEVCKRYKQYQQQMQMVVSSFESVAGLSAATPYVSLALKMVSKHFRCLKTAIADSLKSIINALGEDLSSPTAGTSMSKSDAGVSMLKFFDQSFQKQKGAAGLGILEGQHIWRPQRGLPERAVSILRAWLFDHFLHPYPTDTDKHMLAAQTGLTRNQVSNWFINARVRVWKPMVEEIHMLETKGLAAETGSDAGKTNGMKSAIEDCDEANNKQVECSSIRPSEREVDRLNANTWNQEKRSRIEYHVPSSVDGSLMGLVPSHHSGVEFGGLGAVSLTLGLRQSAENAQRPSMQQEHHLRPHFGGQIIRDFVG
ncbi:BEL1-like homeodomain protein 8 [Sesamum alatum]|uniref:BEL1-like homeodomain protein 8 n=1 Tax=Sesamum alatum TaxID=300844 RepID=A0AAE2D0G2_9LAMI|nr:BEL1-like homeodomain protein 8 [Sesamum alatum]